MDGDTVWTASANGRLRSLPCRQHCSRTCRGDWASIDLRGARDWGLALTVTDVDKALRSCSLRPSPFSTLNTYLPVTMNRLFASSAMNGSRIAAQSSLNQVCLLELPCSSLLSSCSTSPLFCLELCERTATAKKDQRMHTRVSTEVYRLAPSF